MAGPLAGALRRRLLLWFLLISLVPLLVSNGLGYMRSEVIIEGLVQRYLSGIANLQARHVGEQLDGLARAIAELSSRPVVSAAARGASDAAAVGRVLGDALGEYPEFEAFYVFDEGGDILASAPLDPSDLVLWIGPALQPPHEKFVVRRDETPPRYPYVRLAAPILDGGEGGDRHYLGATVSLGGGGTVFELPQHTAGTVETIIIDREGLPIFFSHPHGHVDYGIPFESPLVDPGSATSAPYPDRQGVPVVGTIVPIPGLSWRLVNEVPVADALQELRELRQISLWLASVLALIVLAAAWMTAGRIVAPVRRLVSATRRLGSGDLSARVDAVGRDEIGELGSSFNSMAEELQQASERVADLHRRELERAAQLATVGELAAGVAHEIKNPIAGISGGMDLISRRVPDDPQLLRITAEIRRQISRVDVAVRDLLSFARPVDPDLVLTDLNAVVDRARTLTAAAAEGAGVTMTEELEPELSVVQADAQLMEQCLVNLLMNAIQAAGSDGRVHIATAVVADGVEVRITDTGDGIPPDHVDRIFKPFFTTKHQGTGLGLSITAGIVERHGGHVSVESEAGDGTTFTVWLPRSTSTRAPDPARPDGPGGQER